MIAGWLAAAPLLFSVPEIDRPIVDLAQVIDPGEEEEIARRLVTHRDATGVQMAVLVVRSTLPQEISDYAQEVFDQWGGGSAERDDGVLFVLAIDDRRNRLHLGYGLEPVIPDSAAQEMLDELRPSLQAGAYGEASLQIVSDVVARTSHIRPGESIAAPLGDSKWLWTCVALLALALGTAWGAMFGKILAAAKVKRVRGDDGRYRKLRGRRVAAFFADRRAQRLVAGMLAMQGAIAIAFFEGVGYVIAYSFAAWLYFGLGWLAGATQRRFGWTFGVTVVIALGIAAIAPIGPEGSVGAGDIAAMAAGVAFLDFLFGGLLALCVWGYGVGGAHGGGGTYSSSYTTTSSSYESSSYGSTSYASTSYASTSYSGGGGSSGGGGASSSW